MSQELVFQPKQVTPVLVLTAHTTQIVGRIWGHMSSAAKVTLDCAPRDGPQWVMGECLPYLLGGTVPPAPAFSPLRYGMWESRRGNLGPQ